MGALLAFEVARKLEQLGLVPSSLFVSACRAAYCWADNRQLKSRLTDAALTKEIRQMNGTPESLLLNAELMELILPIILVFFGYACSKVTISLLIRNRTSEKSAPRS